MSTEPARMMRGIVQTSAPVLKAAGFRKRRYCFNRVMPGGLVHVVFFWQAPKEPPTWTEVPGLRERLYGTFRIDFGVHVPEMTRYGTPRSDWIRVVDCHLRTTIGELLGFQGDLWYPLDAPDAATWGVASIEQHGLPWLDRFPDHEHIVDAFRSPERDSMGLTPAGPLDIAQMLAARGRPDEERAVLEEWVSQPVQFANVDYLREYLASIGHPDLVARLPGHS